MLEGILRCGAGRIWCRSRRARLAAVVIALAVVGAACGATPASRSHPTTRTTGSTTVTTTGKPETVLDQQGSGMTTTRSFTVPRQTAGWDLHWSSTCPASARQLGLILTFAALLYRGDSRVAGVPAVTATAASGQGTQHYGGTGIFDFHIGSLNVCTWSVSVVVSG
jgi:hypothetical protein